MPQAAANLTPAPVEDFAFRDPACHGAALRLSLSAFTDRPRLRDELRDDADAAGFHLAGFAELAGLRADNVCPLADVVVVDCPIVDDAVLNSLSRLDRRAVNAGTDLIISTSVDALDAVFGVFRQSEPQILVAPSRPERLVALGRVLARPSASRVRELSEEDRRTMVRLSEQVLRLAERLDRMDPQAAGTAPVPAATEGSASAFRFDAAPTGDGGVIAAAKPRLPDPRVVRRVIRQRQLRARFFDSDLFADPAWDMLLDLTAASGERARVSVTSLCIASGVPPTTALRWIGQMTEAGLFMRVEDENDRRRAFIALTEKAADAMARYFAELTANGAPVL